MDRYKVAVIGGGPAGYVAAVKAAQLGANVVLFEKDNLGGTCLNRGCIPSKTYLKNAEILENIHAAAQRGINLDLDSLSVDLKKAVAYKNRVVKKLSGGIKALLKSYGVTIISGEAVVNPDKTIVIGDTTVAADQIILATGSIVSVPPIPGADTSGVVTSDEILDWKEAPQSLAIVGGGVIGIEMARIFHAYGTQVHIVEMEERLCPFFDEEIAAEVHKDLTKKKVKVQTATSVQKIAKSKHGLSLTLSDGKTLEVEKVLVATGRKPDLGAIQSLNLKMDRGFIVVNDEMETSMKDVFAPGDVNGRSMLAHAASKMGEIAAANAVGGSHKVNLTHVPSVVYGHPEIGCVGLTEAKASELGEITVSRFPFQGNGRAVASGEAEGYIKMIIDSRYHEILGVHIIGPNASELINQAAILMQQEITADELAESIQAHPTNSEALMEAAAATLGICIHLPRES
ncbi:dihydrolipoyl dehydrogenase [bacterium M21]|nr:dihydrolipoyl dehydrogenase [bacterium M21]